MKTTDTLVLFYGRSEVYSNWNHAGFWVKNLYFANGEQYRMYAKATFFGDLETAAEILAEPDPAKVKALGRKVRGYDDNKWAENRLRFVRRGLLEKARQHADIRAQLLATGNKLLAEASPSDDIWGIGLRETDPAALDPSKWRGQNLLGQAWMWVRDQLRAEVAQAV